MMFASGMKESLENAKIETETRMRIFYRLLEYCYTATTSLTPNNVVEILMASNQYRLGSLKQLCETNILKHIDETNAAEFLHLGHFYESALIKSYAIDFISKRYEIVKESEGFAELPEELKVELLQTLNGQVHHGKL